jgi:hypothetical protein
VDYSSITAIENQPLVNVDFYFQDSTLDNTTGYAVTTTSASTPRPSPNPPVCSAC